MQQPLEQIGVAINYAILLVCLLHADGAPAGEGGTSQGKHEEGLRNPLGFMELMRRGERTLAARPGPVGTIPSPFSTNDSIWIEQLDLLEQSADMVQRQRAIILTDRTDAKPPPRDQRHPLFHDADWVKYEDWQAIEPVVKVIVARGDRNRGLNFATHSRRFVIIHHFDGQHWHAAPFRLEHVVFQYRDVDRLDDEAIKQYERIDQLGQWVYKRTLYFLGDWGPPNDD
jgi:hypothetical protein